MGINWDAVQWGTVGSWVSGLGSLGAVVVAIWIAMRENRRMRDQHANMVHISLGRSTEFEGTRVRIVNGSPGQLFYPHLLGPGMAGGAAPIIASKASIKPGKAWETVVPDDDKWTGIVFFADVNGRAWAWNQDDREVVHLSRAKHRHLAYGSTRLSRFRGEVVARLRRLT